MAQIIYTMKKLRKTTPQGKEILKGIWLSFYDGAKIGVLGHNGAGKSTLLRIMAGLDKDYDGEAFLSEGYTVGFLQQEPPLDPSKTVLQHVEDAVSEKKAVLARYEELSMNYSDETADEFSRLQDRIDHENLWELDRGAGIPWEGNYSSWLAQKDARLAQEEKESSTRRRTLQHELEWIQLSPRARHAKGKARINDYEKLLAEEQAQESRRDPNEIHIPPGPRLGDLVVEAKSLSKAYGDNVLMDKLSFILPRGGIVGVIGPNGAGKTTLFRMIVGQEKPDAGELRIGETVALAYVDQSRETLSGTNTLWEELSDGGKDLILIGKKEVNSRAYCAAFNFRGADQQKKVRDLSGGERNRLHLAKILKSGGNLLLLDEPTNDLDVDTLRALEDALLEFAGCAVVISHDRWFLDRIATHILAFEGDSEVVWFEGNYQDYEADRKRRLGADADQPHRLKYRKLVH